MDAEGRYLNDESDNPRHWGKEILNLAAAVSIGTCIVDVLRGIDPWYDAPLVITSDR